MSTKLNLTHVLLLGLVALLALTAWRPQAPGTAQVAPVEEACNPARSVTVSGASVIYVMPDRALLQFGVQSNGATPERTQQENSQQIQKVIRALRTLGVEAKDIATDRYIVYPVYEEYNSLVIKGYRLDNTVSVTLRDVSLAETVIVAALQAGVNEIQDVQFYTSELRKFRDQARELAMKAASEKAQALAGAAGAQVGCIVSISENTSSQYYGSWRGGRQTALWAQNVVQNAGSSPNIPAGSDESPINLGQIAVRAEVNTHYSLK